MFYRQTVADKRPIEGRLFITTWLNFLYYIIESPLFFFKSADMLTPIMTLVISSVMTCLMRQMSKLKPDNYMRKATCFVNVFTFVLLLLRTSSSLLFLIIHTCAPCGWNAQTIFHQFVVSYNNCLRIMHTLLMRCIVLAACSLRPMSILAMQSYTAWWQGPEYPVLLSLLIVYAVMCI